MSKHTNKHPSLPDGPNSVAANSLDQLAFSIKSTCKVGELRSFDPVRSDR
jgi:hypothetical protein